MAAELEVAPGYDRGGFEVEHFKPAKKFPATKFVYSNLLWSCRTCNSRKRESWPKRGAGKRWINPRRQGLGKHLEIVGTAVAAKSADGTFMLNRLRLNGPIHKGIRERRLNNIKSAEVVEKALAVFKADTPELVAVKSAMEASLAKIREQLDCAPSASEVHICPKRKRKPKKASVAPQRKRTKKDDYVDMMVELGIHTRKAK